MLITLHVRHAAQAHAFILFLCEVQERETLDVYFWGWENILYEGGVSSGNLTPSLPSCHLKTTSKREKCETLQPCFLLRTGMWNCFIKTRRIESRCVIGPEKYAVCRRVRASFRPEIVQAGAVKGTAEYVYSAISVGSPLGWFSHWNFWSRLSRRTLTAAVSRLFQQCE